MVIKKINAVCTWCLILILVLHIILMCVPMLLGLVSDSESTMRNISEIFSGIVSKVAIVHIFLSLILVFFFHDGSNFKYKEKNMRVIIQRASSLLILAFLHPHLKVFDTVLSADVLPAASKIALIIPEILFFIGVFIHSSISFSRSLISLGLIRTEIAEKRADVFSRIFNAILFLFSSFSYIYFIVTH